MGEPGLPSKLPSPPSPSSSSSSGPGGPGPGPQNLFGRIPPVPALQNGIPNAVPPPPIAPAPFGLDHITLILVPQFKAKIQSLPDWFGTSVKFSFPITVFFDKLSVPGGSPFMGNGLNFVNGHFVKKRSVSNSSEERFQEELPPLNASIHGAEQAVFIPKLERILKSTGLGGKDCLLRAICEVHEAQMYKQYGLLGELFTMFLSMSRSAYAKTHLPEHLDAETAGKNQMCSQYFEKCSRSIFL